MASTSSMEIQHGLRKLLLAADPDLVNAMLHNIAQTLMSVQADEQCGAEYGERSPARLNSRNGYRRREWDTRAGTIELAIPKLRQGSYFPDWLLEPRRRAERAMTAVVAEAYVLGVSTRRVEELVQAMGVDGISKSQVSELAKSLDGMVEAFRNRPLDAGPYPYVWLDALTQRCREGGRVVNVATVVATAVNADGHREILGLDVFTSEDGAAWTNFLRGWWPEGWAESGWSSRTPTRA
jgi:putative transposase